MKKLFLIMSLSYLHAYHPIELAQPFCEVGVILRENFIGPLSIKTQINSLIKGAFLGAINHSCSTKDKALEAKITSIKNYQILTNTSNLVVTIDLIKNYKNSCLIAQAIGFYSAKTFITKYLK